MEFKDIYDQHEARVKKFVRALVRDEWAADDLVQETFISVQKNLARLRDPSRLSAWVFKIAYNHCRDHFRQANQLSKKEQALDEIRSRHLPVVYGFRATMTRRWFMQPTSADRFKADASV